MIFLYIIAWYLSGLAGSFLVLEYGFRRNGLSVTVGSLVLGALMALVGPVNWFVGIVILILSFLERSRIMSTVLFEGKDRP